jgi:hypothetical protein
MRRVTVAFVAGLSVIAGCTSSEVLVAHSVPLATAKQEIPESQLLDVGVSVFDSGVPEGEVDKEVLEGLIREGTFVQIRRTEAIYMAMILRDTLQKSRNWGTVWVTPKDSTAADLSVDSKILHSDGDTVKLHVNAHDATGRVWLDKDYEMSTAAGAFNRQRYPDLDPYQDVFNEIANDLATARAALSEHETDRIRTVAGLRYAADLSPEAFANYVEQKKGSYELVRLPAEGDPQFDRTQRVRQRERLFLDTLDQHYSKFQHDATESYDGWREYSREEAIEVRELTKSARFRTGMGIATIVASIVYGSQASNDSFSDRVIRDAMMYIGMDMLRTSQVRKQEKKLHSDTLEELSSSFDDEIKPMIVEVQGTAHRLTGTAEAQYQEWRDLLRQIFVAEGGFVPEEVAIYTEPDPVLPVEDPLPTLASPASGDAQPADALESAEALGVALPTDALEPPPQPADAAPPADGLSEPGDAAPAAVEPEAPAEGVSDAAATLASGA